MYCLMNESSLWPFNVYYWIKCNFQCGRNNPSHFIIKWKCFQISSEWIRFKHRERMDRKKEGKEMAKWNKELVQLYHFQFLFNNKCSEFRLMETCACTSQCTHRINFKFIKYIILSFVLIFFPFIRCFASLKTFLIR